MKKLTFLLCLSFMSFFAYAQPANTDYITGRVYEGYIITNKGERVSGYIRLDEKLSMQKKITFWLDKNNRKTKAVYKGGSIQSFYVAEREYRTVKTTLGPLTDELFLLLNEDGQISLYTAYSYDDEKKEIVEEMVIQKKGEKSLSKLKLTFKFAKTMSAYISDYPELSKKVKDKEKGYRLLSLLDIIKEYNDWYEDTNK